MKKKDIAEAVYYQLLFEGYEIDYAEHIKNLIVSLDLKNK